jgi:hypothetical protein
MKPHWQLSYRKVDPQVLRYKNKQAIKPDSVV